ncbi:hypothetical protein RJT34_25313 [Clitoria ternatea]|uniref:Uncharacterized protein n=1 Tax=Clitoria ternatea TaxID=43366 RepID=A0AAN9FSA8_CLITE
MKEDSLNELTGAGGYALTPTLPLRPYFLKGFRQLDWSTSCLKLSEDVALESFFLPIMCMCSLSASRRYALSNPVYESIPFPLVSDLSVPPNHTSLIV